MEKLEIIGGKKLSGTIAISGSKNATLPILAATILTNKKIVIKNVPIVRDVETMVALLNAIGSSVKLNKKKKIIEILNKNKLKTLAPYSLVKTMRAGVLVLGPLLAKYGLAKVSLPGGCSIGSRPIDLHLNALKKMGATIKVKNNFIEVSSDKVLKPINEDLNHIPDAAMTLAILSLYADGVSVLKNIGSWRVKETDRLKAMSTELRKVGAKIIEGKDFLQIEPPLKIKNASIDTYDDHRMAMCFSLVSLNSYNKKGGIIKINDPNCVSKTFPDYFDYFK